MNWRAAVNTALSSLFEPPCAACTRVLPNPLDGAVCEACWDQVRSAAAPLVEVRSGDQALDALCAIGEYEGRLRDIIHALKYDRRRSIAPPLGSMMRAAAAPLLHDAHVVVPVPLHPSRQRARGFNQAEDLARALGPPVRRLLRRVIATAPQVELPATERHRNVRDAFAVSFPARIPFPTGMRFPTRIALPARMTLPTRLRARASARQASLPTGSSLPAVIVLVDDVSTTGATLNACALVLKSAGAREVRAVTAARVATARR
jgi:predicted amidophosphoribosyltransferase